MDALEIREMTTDEIVDHILEKEDDMSKINPEVATDLHKQGLTDKELAQRFDVTVGAVYQWRKKNNLPPNSANKDVNEVKLEPKEEPKPEPKPQQIEDHKFIQVLKEITVIINSCDSVSDSLAVQKAKLVLIRAIVDEALKC